MMQMTINSSVDWVANIRKYSESEKILTGLFDLFVTMTNYDKEGVSHQALLYFVGQLPLHSARILDALLAMNDEEFLQRVPSYGDLQALIGSFAEGEVRKAAANRLWQHISHKNDDVLAQLIPDNATLAQALQTFFAQATVLQIACEQGTVFFDRMDSYQTLTALIRVFPANRQASLAQALWQRVLKDADKLVAMLPDEASLAQALHDFPAQTEILLKAMVSASLRQKQVLLRDVPAWQRVLAPLTKTDQKEQVSNVLNKFFTLDSLRKTFVTNYGDVAVWLRFQKAVDPANMATLLQMLNEKAPELFLQIFDQPNTLATLAMQTQLPATAMQTLLAASVGRLIDNNEALLGLAKAFNANLNIQPSKEKYADQLLDVVLADTAILTQCITNLEQLLATVRVFPQRADALVNAYLNAYADTSLENMDGNSAASLAALMSLVPRYRASFMNFYQTLSPDSQAAMTAYLAEDMDARLPALVVDMPSLLATLALISRNEQQQMLVNARLAALPGEIKQCQQQLAAKKQRLAHCQAIIRLKMQCVSLEKQLQEPLEIRVVQALRDRIIKLGFEISTKQAAFLSGQHEDSFADLEGQIAALQAQEKALLAEAKAIWDPLLLVRQMQQTGLLNTHIRSFADWETCVKQAPWAMACWLSFITQHLELLPDYKALVSVYERCVAYDGDGEQTYTSSLAALFNDSDNISRWVTDVTQWQFVMKLAQNPQTLANLSGHIPQTVLQQVTEQDDITTIIPNIACLRAMLDTHKDRETQLYVAKLLLANNTVYRQFCRQDLAYVASLVVPYDVSLVLADKITPEVCQRLYEHRQALGQYLQESPQDLAVLLDKVNVLSEQTRDVVNRSVLQLSVVLSAYERQHRTAPTHTAAGSHGFFQQRGDASMQSSSNSGPALKKSHSWTA